MIRIVSAEPLPECRLKVTFNDGVSGIFAVEPERRGGVFLKLLDAKIFNAVTVNPDFGCVEWPGGIDLCPDTMHAGHDRRGSGSTAGSGFARARQEIINRERRNFHLGQFGREPLQTDVGKTDRPHHAAKMFQGGQLGAIISARRRLRNG